MAAYEPKPLDTSGIPLSEAMRELTEKLAEHAHAVWARNRLAEGWTLGPARDDARKEHPCLIPYEELPESEKEYDRSTALESIRALLALGYRLEPSLPLVGGTVGTLEDFVARGRRFLQQGDPLLAYDVLTSGLAQSPGNLQLRQLLALALLRSGATSRASAVVEALRGEGHRDEETLGLLARVRKSHWSQATEVSERTRRLRLARDAYLDAFRTTGGYWTGINAATMTLLLYERDLALQLAQLVARRCSELLACKPDGDPERFWLYATCGEAALVRGAWNEAEDWYGRAGTAGRGRWLDLKATRENARLLLAHLGRDGTPLERLLAGPPVILFAGHEIDRPDRSRPRFPSRLEGQVRDAIAQRVGSLGGGFGYSSAACGADLIFLETLVAGGGESHVVLPYDPAHFRADSVDVAAGDWGERFVRALATANEVVTASNYRIEGDLAVEYGVRLLTGLAAIRADQLGAELRALAVWDRRSADERDRTAISVGTWRALGVPVEIIDLASSEPAESAPLVTAPSQARSGSEERDGFTPQIMAFLFGDAVHFSQLTEDGTCRFVERFLGQIGGLLGRTDHAPMVRNTWGDGLYFAFATVRDAGLFALELADAVNRMDREAMGLPPDLNLRIGLHAGPAYVCRDPITSNTNYVGTHVSQAARIEPITPPGMVYASRAFAALARASGVQEFSCDYVGRIPLAKAYGTLPMYHLRRSASARHAAPTRVAGITKASGAT